ncbi:hypothetical protein BpHYR1_053372 [Brachionus plicatilis]|uniref:Uncharacterized protein n=1 Tax=Brachionus plicatilis TaxID=10195 RepID=A0A3M7S760_BRAPC|nr:hypothetical protein BpHYR1_053372 [Brachionus plicatilis]
MYIDMSQLCPANIKQIRGRAFLAYLVSSFNKRKLRLKMKNEADTAILKLLDMTSRKWICRKEILILMKEKKWSNQKNFLSQPLTSH